MSRSPYGAAEVVEGSIVIWPVRKTHWQITRSIVAQLCARYPAQKADARIDYPGHLNGFATDVTLVAEGAEKNERGLWRYQDVVFVTEVIWKGTAHNDYGTVAFGAEVDMTTTLLGLTLKTDEFPRD